MFGLEGTGHCLGGGRSFFVFARSLFGSWSPALQFEILRASLTDAFRMTGFLKGLVSATVAILLLLVRARDAA